MAKLNMTYDDGESQQQQFVLFTGNPPTAAPGLINYPLAHDDRAADFDQGLDIHSHDRLYQAVVRADYAVTDSMQLTLLTNYANFVFRHVNDGDGTALPIGVTRSDDFVKTINQEVRLAGTIGGAHYIVGGNYEHDDLRDDSVTALINHSGVPHGAVFDSDFLPGNEAKAVFGNVDYEIVPRVTLTGGLRYTETEQTLKGCTKDDGNGIASGFEGFLANGVLRPLVGLGPTDAYVPGGCTTINVGPVGPGTGPTYLPYDADLTQRQNNVSWRSAINFKPGPDSLLYGLVSRGYKSGVFPVQVTLFSSQITPVAQEELTSYEVGFKTVLFDRALRFDVSAFYYDYRNKQFYTYKPEPPIGNPTTVVNIPKSTVEGVDADLVVTPSSRFTLRSAVTYIRTRVGKYMGYNFLGEPVDFGGKQFNFAPPWSGTFDAEYHQPVGHDRELFFGSGGMFNSRTFGDLGESPQTRIPGYLLIDARLGLRSSKGWRIGLFARNLTDKFYWTNVAGGTDVYTRYAGFPRTFGVNGGYSF
jgi:iron complex outermembrane receptor protein